MAKERKAKVNKKRCVACGACISVCPRMAIEIRNGSYAQVSEGLCVGCGKCERICPAASIKVEEDHQNEA